MDYLLLWVRHIFLATWRLDKQNYFWFCFYSVNPFTLIFHLSYYWTWNFGLDQILDRKGVSNNKVNDLALKIPSSWPCPVRNTGFGIGVNFYPPVSCMYYPDSFMPFGDEFSVHRQIFYNAAINALKFGIKTDKELGFILNLLIHGNSKVHS